MPIAYTDLQKFVLNILVNCAAIKWTLMSYWSERQQISKYFASPKFNSVTMQRKNGVEREPT